MSNLLSSKEEEEELKKQIEWVIDMQLCLCFDTFTSEDAWKEILTNADVNILAKLLSFKLHDVGLNAVAANRILENFRK